MSVIDVLPQDIIIQVCSYISPKDLACFLRANKCLHMMLGSSVGLRLILSHKYNKNSAKLHPSELWRLLLLSENEERFGVREMAITWINSPVYWKIQEGYDSHFAEIAVLLNVCWLDVRLEYRGIPRGRYRITWRMQTVEMPEDDVTFYASFEPPHNHTSMTLAGHEVKFADSKGKWIEVSVGEVEVRGREGKLIVGFFEHSNSWKSGLAIDYVEVRWVGDIK